MQLLKRKLPMEHYFKPFTFLQKMRRALAKNIYLKRAPNGSQVYLVADLEAQNLNLIQNENRNTKLG